MQFIDVRTDFAFKKVFGSEESKDILLSFLNAVLNLDGHFITDLTIVNPYQVPLVEGLKETYVDIKARLENGTTVIIEMQAYNQGGFGKRVQSNLAKAYSTQLQPGDKYIKHNPTIALTITDFVMLTDEKLKSSVITSFKFMETSQLVLFPYNELEIVFVELPKFHKTESELSSMADKWIYFIKQAGHLTAIPQSLAEDETLNHALEVANLACLTPSELEIHDKKMRWLADQEELQAERKANRERLVQLKTKEQAIEAKEQAIEAKEQTIEAEKQAIEAKEQTIEAKEQAIEAEKQAIEAKEQTIEAEKQAIEAKEQAAIEKVAKAESITKLKMAKQMLQAKIDLTLIMQMTGLDEASIKNL